MQLFQIRKLLPKISQKISRRQTKSRVETLDAPQAAGDDVTEQIHENEGQIPTADCSSEDNNVSGDTEEVKVNDSSSASPTEKAVSETAETTEGKVDEVKIDVPKADKSNTARVDNGLSHMTSGVPRGASVPRGVMTASELNAARELFGNIDEREIMRLYKKVTQ